MKKSFNYFTLFVQAVGATGYITFYFNPTTLTQSFLFQEDFNIKYSAFFYCHLISKTDVLTPCLRLTT